MITSRKSRISLFVFLLIFCLFLNQPAVARDCGNGTMSTLPGEYTPYPKITVSCVNESGAYFIGGGSPSFELWGRDCPDGDWYLIRPLTQEEEEARTFNYSCELRQLCEPKCFEIQIRASQGNKSNSINIYKPRTFGTLQWNPNNPEEIEQGASVGISISGGTWPYTWEVSGGTGFSLSETHTDGLTNSLHASESADGTAHITVEDYCGAHTSGNVTCVWPGCENGHWELLCKGANTSGSCAGWTWYETYPNATTKLRLAVGCHYHPYECIYFSCGGYTSYIPAAANNKCGSSDWTINCGLQESECVHASVWLEVYKWACD